MKKIILSLAIALSGYCADAQNTPWSTTGNIGIGTTNPGYPLDVVGDIRNTGNFHNSKGSYWFLNGTSGASNIAAGGMTISNNYNFTPPDNGLYVQGNVGIGTTSPYANLDVAGSSAGYIGGKVSFFATASGLNVPSNALTIVHNGGWSAGNVTPTLLLANNFSGANLNQNIVALDFTAGDNSGVFTNPASRISTITSVNDPALIFSVSNNTFSSLNEQMRITASGNIGIGTIQPDTKLTVNGTIHSTEVKVTATVPPPDYVFDNDYKLLDLNALKDYLNANHHLPEIPSAAEMEKNGLNLSEMNLKLLKKVEELTLHAIDQQKQIEQLKQDLTKSKDEEKRIAALEAALEKLSKTLKDK